MRNLKNCIASDPAFSVPGIYPEEVIRNVHKIFRYMDVIYLTMVW